MDHWLCILDRENFEVVKSKKIYGISDRYRNSLMGADVVMSLCFISAWVRTIPGGDL